MMCFYDHVYTQCHTHGVGNRRRGQAQVCFATSTEDNFSFLDATERL